MTLRPQFLDGSFAATGSSEAPAFPHVEVLPVFNHPLDGLEPMLFSVLRERRAHGNWVDDTWIAGFANNPRGLVHEGLWLWQ